MIPQSSQQSPTPLCLLCIHAHPDDESSKGSVTVNRYSKVGVHCVLVCATGGEEGEILNPAMDRPEVHARLAEVRQEELALAAEVIGYHEVIYLGYRDSGMADSSSNQDPACFARADHDEAVGRLVAIIRRTRPQVVVTYADDQQGYPHPDHLRVHDVSVAAYDAASSPDAYPDAGPPWAPAKLYYWCWSKARIQAMHDRFLALGLESPFTDEGLARAGLDDRITTRIPVPVGSTVRRDALLAHATQIDPASPFWFGLPEDVDPYPYEDLILARSNVASAIPEGDLFSGITG